MIINSDENIWSINKETIEVIQISNHQETGKRLVFHVGISNEATVTFAKDTDMFLILIF